MARRVERGQRASARTLPSDHRPQFSQPSQPRTPFSVPQRDGDNRPQFSQPPMPFSVPQKDDDHRRRFSQPPRPETPLGVPQRGDDTSPKWGKHWTSIKDPRDFAPPGVIGLTRHKFRSQKPYEDKTFKVPDSRTADSLRRLRASIMSTSRKKTLDPIKELKENQGGKVPLSREVPECRSNPMSGEPRPSALQPATRPIPGKVKRSLAMSTVFEEPMDIDQSDTRVSATSSGRCAGDASEKFKDDTVPGPSSADSSTDQRGPVISPHIQGALQTSPPTHGALRSSPSFQDAQELSLSTQEVLRRPQCEQGAMGHSPSGQTFQRPLTCAERKIKHVSSSRRGFRSPSSNHGVTNHSSSPPKSFRQGPSDQGGLQQAPSDKEASKPCPKWGLSDFSFSQNGLSPTTSPQGTFTPLTAAKGGWRGTPSNEDSQGRFPSPQKDPKQSTSAEVSLSPASSDQGNFITLPLNQEGFKCPPPLKNGLSSSLTAKSLTPTSVPQVCFTPLLSAQAETKLSTSIPGSQRPFPSAEGVLESSIYMHEVLGTPKSAQGTLGPSQHTQRALAPSPSSSGVLSPPISVKGTLGWSTSRVEGQRPILSHKRRFEPSPVMKRDPKHCHFSQRRWRDAPFKQGDFTVSLLDQEGFKYPLLAKKAILSHHWAQNNQIYSKIFQVSHTLPPAPMAPGHSSLTRASPSPSPSLKKDDKSCLYTQAPLELNTSSQSSLDPLPSIQEPEQDPLYAKPTLEQPTSAQQPEGPSGSTSGTLGSNQSAQKELGVFPTAQVPVINSLSMQGTLASCSSAQQALGPSLSAQGPLKPFTPTQGTVETVPSSQMALKHPTASQEVPRYFLSAQRTFQASETSKRALGPFLHSHENQGPFLSSAEDAEHSPFAPDAQEHPLSVPGTLEHLLSSKGNKELSTTAKKTLPVISFQRALEPSVHFSPSVQSPRETSLFNKVPRGLSSHAPSDPAPLLSAHWPLELSISAEGPLSSSASTKGTLSSSLPARPNEGGYGRYYRHVDYQQRDEGRCFAEDPKSGPAYKRGHYGYRRSRDEYSTNRQPEYRAMRNDFRRKRFYSSHYSRQRSPHKRGVPFLRESRVSRKDSLPSRFGSSLSSRSRMRSFHQSRHRSKERAIQVLKTSRDTVPSNSSAKVFKSPSRLTEKEHADAASKCANENPKKSEENNLAEISEFETGSKAPLCINQTEEPESNTTAGPELCEDSQLSSRSKAIASKITDIEKVYRQVCETFGMVVERLVEKDPSLEKPIQFAMKQSLHEIGEQQVEELKYFIMEYDNSTPDFGDPI